jgi:hypothetical protein
VGPFTQVQKRIDPVSRTLCSNHAMWRPVERMRAPILPSDHNPRRQRFFLAYEAVHSGHSDRAVTALLLIPSLMGIGGFLFNGWHSDKKAERRWNTAIPLLIAGLMYGA